MSTLGATPARHDFFIRQGCGLGPYRLEITASDGTPRDITGWQLEGSLRRSPKASEAVAEVNYELTNPEAGELRFWIDAADTFIPCGESELDRESKYWLDIDLITPADFRIPILRGPVRVAAKGDLEPTP